MKRGILLLVLSLFVSLTMSAQQKYAYIYSEKVFKSMPEYTKALSDLESYAKSATEKSKEMLEEVKTLYAEYVKYRGSMTASQRKAQEQMLISKEKTANNYESEFFGEDGDMNRRQKELMDPIEKRVVEAVNAVTAEGGYDMIFDLSTVRSTIYQSEKLDLTQTVINRLK